jgi:hypothetical protein
LVGETSPETFVKRLERVYLECKVQVASRIVLGLDIDSNGLLPHRIAALVKHERLELGNRLLTGAGAKAVVDGIAVVVPNTHKELINDQRSDPFRFSQSR